MQSQCSGAHVFQEGVSVATRGCWVCMKAASALLCGFGMVPKVLCVLLQYLNWTSGRIKFKVSTGVTGPQMEAKFLLYTPQSLTSSYLDHYQAAAQRYS